MLAAERTIARPRMNDAHVTRRSFLEDRRRRRCAGPIPPNAGGGRSRQAGANVARAALLRSRRNLFNGKIAVISFFTIRSFAQPEGGPYRAQAILLTATSASWLRAASTRC